VQLGAAQRATHIEQPVEQGAAMALAARMWSGREVVDVEVVTPRERVANPETGDCDGLFAGGLKGADQPVAGRPKHGVHVLDEARLGLV
jgi:hypothetical protein